MPNPPLHLHPTREMTMSTDLTWLSANEAAARFRDRSLSPVEYLQAQIDQWTLAEPSVGATAFQFFDTAMEAAKAAESVFVNNPADARVLEGIPLAIKDEMDVAGQPCTFGSLIYKDNVADTTAPLADRMLAAGAIPHLRTRTPEFSCAGFTHSRLWGVSHNPWNTAFDVGGSSGGSGAALASGLTPLAGGSDIGGSIRIPSSCNGVVGYKPPYGRVPQHPAFNLDHYCHEGPMARTVADVALFTNIIAGQHPHDITSLPKPADLPLSGSSIKGLKIAVCHHLGDYPVDPDMLANLDASADALRQAGATVEVIELPWTREQIMHAAKIHYGAIFAPSVGRAVAEYRDIMTDYAIHFAEEGAEVMQNATFLEGISIEGEIYAPLGELLLDYDAMICPTLAVPALQAGVSYVTERIPVAGTEITQWEHLMTVPFNICSRLPVLAVPSGFAQTGVPTGIQIVGRAFDDLTTFEIAYALERERPWAQTRPSFA